MQLTLTPHQLSIQLEWYEQLWAFTLHNPIVIPLAHLVGATTEKPQSRWTDLRAPGTYLPGVIKAGTYYTRAGKEFWYVTADPHVLTLELCEEPYQRLILALENPQDWATRLTQAKESLVQHQV
ncbi:MAG: hypothetical protein HC771_01350 [Synechococcales cyanobacterium CRU_2_2]|nr:hypothetical protein [Synechococcales cyanobacterium CRU_2_2]